MRLWAAQFLVVILAVAVLGASAGAQAPEVVREPGREPGAAFRDCPACPEMVVLPAGEYFMGSALSERPRERDEGPRHLVKIPSPFAIARYETTFAEWDACVADGGCNGHAPDDGGWGRGSQPVMNVNHADARAFVAWLNQRAGAEVYRLPSEAEWEYAARGGALGPFTWGLLASRDHANYGAEECCSGLAEGADRWVNTAPVGQFPANAFGLFDMQGNVWEWTADCYAPDYEPDPDEGGDKRVDSRAYEEDGCTHRVIRGGSWLVVPHLMRLAYRVRYPPGERRRMVGFRVARSVE